MEKRSGLYPLPVSPASPYTHGVRVSWLEHGREVFYSLTFARSQVGPARMPTPLCATREYGRKYTGASLGSLLEFFLLSFLCFGIGIAILAFADYELFGILILGGIGIASMVCAVARLFSHSILLGITATVVCGAYLVGTMTFGVGKISHSVAGNSRSALPCRFCIPSSASGNILTLGGNAIGRSAAPAHMERSVSTNKDHNPIFELDLRRENLLSDRQKVGTTSR